MGHWHQMYRPRLRWWWKPWTWRRRPVVVPGTLVSVETYRQQLAWHDEHAAEYYAEVGRRAYEHWCETKRVAPPLVAEWDDLTDEQRQPFLGLP